LRHQVFFQKTYQGAKEICKVLCNFCSEKGIKAGAMLQCIECKKNVCFSCSDFHETAYIGHTLKIHTFEEEEKEENICEQTQM
jgi:hypothetical protein